MNKKKFSPIDGSIIESLSKILGDTENGLTGSEIERHLKDANITDIDPNNTKWKRLYNAFVTIQNKENISNKILRFINIAMSPARFIDDKKKFEEYRDKLNKTLSFIGLELNEEGVFNPSKKSSTISEAEKKANKLKNKLEQRNTHSLIFKYTAKQNY